VSSPALRRAELDGACVNFRWSDGFEATFASAWLWDNAPADTRVGVQRLRSAQSLVAAGAIRAVAIDGDIVRLAFSDETLEWPGAQLRACAARRGDTPDERVLWPLGTDIAARPVIPCKDYLADDKALRSALADVAQFGLVRLSGARTALDEVERVVGRFGFIRETNYGRLFEVRVVADPDNLAFTARALEPHTDNPYRDPVPTLQLLHCIQDSGSGGATFLLDGFALAEWFCAQHPQDFARLAGHAVPFAYENAGGDRYSARTPVLRLDADGRLTGLRFNHRALQAIDFDAAETAQWYNAYLNFAKAADARERHFSFAMRPGDIVIFDNERVLHGREAFAGASNRLLRGCYSDRDGLLATLARLRRDGARTTSSVSKTNRILPP
jgi:alpha-ketoglutarate-dependent taurine dioxygenase